MPHGERGGRRAGNRGHGVDARVHDVGHRELPHQRRISRHRALQAQDDFPVEAGREQIEAPQQRRSKHQAFERLGVENRGVGGGQCSLSRRRARDREPSDGQPGKNRECRPHSVG